MEISFSAEEERFSGIKGGKRYSPFTVQFPYKSMYAALEYLDIKISDVDVIALSYDKWEHFKGMFSKRWSYYDDYYALRALFHTKRILSSDYEMFQYMSDRLTPYELKKYQFYLLIIIYHMRLQHTVILVLMKVLYLWLIVVEKKVVLHYI